MNNKEKAELEAFLADRNDLFRNPTAEKALAYLTKSNPGWRGPHPQVALGMVHKARLQWLGCTNAMMKESMDWLTANGFETSMKGAPPITPESRDADRVSLGMEPLGDAS